jgi:hypothetical protein
MAMTYMRSLNGVMIASPFPYRGESIGSLLRRPRFANPRSVNAAEITSRLLSKRTLGQAKCVNSFKSSDARTQSLSALPHWDERALKSPPAIVGLAGENG